jgi:hypothetical protein
MTMLRPALTLRELLGSGARVAGRASDSASRWLPQDPLVRDGNAAGAIAVIGDLPLLAAAGSVTQRVQRLLDVAGIELPPCIETFEGAGDYLAKLDEFTSPGGVYVQHAHPEHELPASRYWLPPDRLRRMNDKEFLGDYVPAAALPRRRTVSSAEFLAAVPPPPFVLKVATGESTGGGAAVALCRTTGDVKRALQRFEGVERFIVEEMLEIEESWCLNFGIFADGRVRYVGGAQQVCTTEGVYAGNWIEEEAPDEAVAPAYEAMERAAKEGYSGFAAADVALTPRGVRVHDLNFRLNGSTMPVLMRDAIRSACGAVVIRVVRQPCERPDWERAVEAAIRARRLVPKSIYDPEGGPHHGRGPLLQAMILGRDRADVASYLASGAI